MALSATANAELKVATVDVQKLFADYYKTHEAQAEVDKAAQTVQETNNTARKPSKDGSGLQRHGQKASGSHAE